MIGKVQFAELARFFADNGSKVPPFMLEKMRPWLISIELAGIYIRKEKSLKSYYGLEKVFTAHKGTRQGHSLESIDSQMSAMASIPDEVMIASIMKSVREPEKAGTRSHACLPEFRRYCKTGGNVRRDRRRDPSNLSEAFC